MSRLTKSPFHAPSPFEFPRAPLSPPETNADTIGPSHLPTSVSVAGAMDTPSGDRDFIPSAAPSTTEPPGARFRRVSSLAYHSSALRDPRERPAHRTHHKSFICVIPPPSILQDHGQLGHTLSLGPHHRLSHGLLMPLFPTMYAQLAAIAKEFNFPSTAGLCLYMHYTDNGITVSPRISDEYWQLFWSHEFDPSSSSTPQRPPICGKVEFDVDLRHARWYTTWLASAHRRENLDLPVSVAPSTAPSVAHFREASRTTMDTADDDQTDVQNLKPRTSRHIPRQLSLVDRLDSASVRSTRVRSALSPPENVITAASVLPPIHQVEEPKSAKRDLESRVKNWRASASLTPTALAAKGQISLEPANMPNSISLDDAMDSDGEVEELNMEDFQWSVSSLGPNDYDPESPVSWAARIPSVHLANRVEGSVCLTPSDCTSFGPSDYTLPSPVASSFRALTPDIAHRMYEDVPVTPSTATSWGPPSVYPDVDSPTSEYYAVSLDLGQRAVSSRPATPLTATSWGPASWPASPIGISRPPSVDLGHRGEFSRPATPSTATSWGAPLSYPPSPIIPHHVTTPDAGQRAFDAEDTQLQRSIFSFPYYDPFQGQPWAFTWPYVEMNRATTSDVSVPESFDAPWEHVWPYNAQVAGPWKHNWPYNSSSLTRGYPGSHLGVSIHLPSNYPNLTVYGPVYPNLEIYPTASAQNKSLSNGYPDFCLYPPANTRPVPSESVLSSASIVVSLPAKYPALQIYCSVYPRNVYETYPAVDLEKKVIDVKLAPNYPAICVYPAIYPYISPYPTTLPDVKVESRSSQYPDFAIYPATGAGEMRLTNQAKRPTMVPKSIPCSVPSLKLTAPYPAFNIYAPVYPQFDIYPAMLSGSRSIESLPQALKSPCYPRFDLYPSRPSMTTVDRKITVHLSASYPTFNIYPAQYPVLEVYPSVVSHSSSGHEVSPGYPSVCIYPPVNHTRNAERKSIGKILQGSSVYPYFDIYPSTAEIHDVSVKEVNMWLTQYPALRIYAPAYPYFDLYPDIHTSLPEKVKLSATSVFKMYRYPVLDIYPAVYPSFSVYPPVLSVIDAPASSTVSVRVYRQYPTLEIYPPAYPHHNIYPPMVARMHEQKELTCSLPVTYPSFQLYPAVYPHFDLWPSRSAPHIIVQLNSRRKNHAELHAMVMKERGTEILSFPYAEPVRPLSRARATHKVLHESVFPHGVVATPSGTWKDLASELPEIVVSDQGSPPTVVSRRRIPSLRSASDLAVRSSVALHGLGGLPPHPGYLRRSGIPEPKREPLERLPSVPSVSPPADRSVGLGRSASLASRPLPSRRTEERDLYPVEEHPIQRSHSTATARHSRPLPSKPTSLDRSQSVSATQRPTPRKRDSLVLQRVKALNDASEQGQDTNLSMDSLSKFPMPPRPLPTPMVPRLPQRLQNP